MRKTIPRHHIYTKWVCKVGEPLSIPIQKQIGNHKNKNYNLIMYPYTTTSRVFPEVYFFWEPDLFIVVSVSVQFNLF